MLNPPLPKKNAAGKIAYVVRIVQKLALSAALLSTAAAEPATNWAYQPLVRPPVPQVANTNRVRNPIDRFILSELERHALAPAREADRRTLLRRVYFDLIGLPPTREEVNAFLADGAPDAWERVVDHLLASPRYGERWARHWMDAIHFAETHGHDQDRIRTNAWPYRDYLIDAFNRDKPYARFVQEQVAGDVLFPDDSAATVALGFLAAGPWDESSLRDIREDSIDRQIARYIDRDDIVTTVMQTFTSTTIQCARCHNHKFDPIPQSDYYALQAVFAGVDRANRAYDADPAVQRKRRELLRTRARAGSDRAWLLSPAVQEQVAQFRRTRAEEQQQWRIIVPETFVSSNGATLVRQADGSLLATGARPDRDISVVTTRGLALNITAVRLEVLTDETLPKRGPGRQENGNLHLSEFQMFVSEPGGEAREIAFARAAADFNQSGWTIEHALDGNEKTAWGIFPKVGEPHRAVFVLKEPLRVERNVALVFVLKQLHGEGHLIGKVRLAVTGAESPGLLAPLPEEIERALARSEAEGTEEERATLGAFVVRENVARELARLPKASLVYAAASEFEPDGGLKPAGGPRTVQVLKRGDIHKPLEVAAPGALSGLSGIPARFTLANEKDEGERRAALARWLTDPANALTWRSIVNRVWHHHFGRGLVETPNDFGRMGGAPSHPELLDWLAVWFRDDAAGSMKALHRLVVTSGTYRQSSLEGRAPRVPAPEGKDGTRGTRPSNVDSENRWLARMNRTRLDADQVRDAILQIAGCLDLRMGGPGDRQFDLQPGHHVTPKVDYAKFDVNSPAGRRRSIYRFLFRTLPDPFMDALDCPAGDQLTPVRNASVTVQQALAMWNDAFVVHYAERFAQRLAASAKTADAQVTLACELALGRAPTETERKEFAGYIERHGLANFCRVLLNSNEFMFVN